MTCTFCDDAAVENGTITEAGLGVTDSLPLCRSHLNDAVGSGPGTCALCSEEGDNVLPVDGVRDLLTLYLCDDHYEPIHENFKEEI